MEKRATMLPVIMVLVISVLALYAIFSSRSNDPGIVGDRNYPFHICTINDYCEAGDCSRDPLHFIVYLEYADGRPRLELPRVNPAVTMTTLPDGLADGLVFETRGGEVSGTLNIYEDRQLDFRATSGAGEELVEHFATGTCERLKTP